MPTSNTTPSYNASRDPMAPQGAPYPITHQPHTTAFSNRAIASAVETPNPDTSFTGSYGHPERDPNMIRSYRGTDDMGAPADLQCSPRDPRDVQGQTGSVTDTGLSRVSYNNQAPAPKTF